MLQRIAFVLAAIVVFGAALAAKPLRNNEPLQKADLRSALDGMIAKVHVKADAIVKKGDLLFELEDAPYRVALAETVARIAEARARFEQSNAELQRAERLFQARAIGREDYDAILVKHQAAEASARLARAKLDAAELNLKNTRVHAPFDGKVIKLHFSAGASVKALDSVVVTIHETR